MGKKSNRLMNKTKEELVNIIFRKDETEQNLIDFHNKTVNRLHNDIYQLDNALGNELSINTSLIKKLAQQENDFQETVDELASERQEFINKLTNYKYLSIILLGLFICMTIYHFIC